MSSTSESQLRSEKINPIALGVKLLDRVESLIPRLYKCLEKFVELDLAEIFDSLKRVMEDPLNIYLTFYHSIPVTGEKMDKTWHIKSITNACTVKRPHPLFFTTETYIIFFPHLLYVSDELLISVMAHEFTHILRDDERMAIFVEMSVQHQCVDYRGDPFKEVVDAAKKVRRFVPYQVLDEALYRRDPDVWNFLCEVRRYLKPIREYLGGI